MEYEGKKETPEGAYVAQPGCALFVGPRLWVCECVSMIAGEGLPRTRRTNEGRTNEVKYDIERDMFCVRAAHDKVYVGS